MTRDRIDTHHHVLPDFWQQNFTRMGTIPGVQAPHWDKDAALALMDETEVRTAILSVSAPGVFFGDADAARTLARRVNDHVAGIVQQTPDRFGFFASLPLPDVEAAVKEAQYSLDTLHADGIVLMANVAGTYLGDPGQDRLFAFLNERAATIFIHPSVLPGPPSPVPAFMADFLLDTTRAAINLVMHDVPQRYPDLKLILSHGGGFLPYAVARFERSLGTIGQDPRSEQFRRFWFDTALTASPSALPSLLAFADPTHITYGSDFPYAEPDVVRGFAHDLDAYPLTLEQRHAIDCGNAETLFPRLAR